MAGNSTDHEGPPSPRMERPEIEELVQEIKMEITEYVTTIRELTIEN